MMSVNILQVLEEGFAQVFTDVLWYQAMGIAQVILCNNGETALKQYFKTLWWSKLTPNAT